jgi:hypothetical protein
MEESDNRAGRLKFGFKFELDESAKFEFLKEIGLSRVLSGLDQVGLIYILCFLIDFDWIKGHLISDRIESDQIQIKSDQFDFFF